MTEHDFEDFGLTMMEWGTQEDTGRRMYLLTRQRVAVVLPRCDGCGRTNILSTPLNYAVKGVDLCYECRNKLHNLESAYLRIDDYSSAKTLQTYKSKVNEYVAAREVGLWVPKSLDRYIHKLNVLEPIILRREAEFQQHCAEFKAEQEVKRLAQYDREDMCSYCGEVKHVICLNYKTGRYVCAECDVRRHRYKSLMSMTDRLSVDECRELDGILDKYEEYRLSGGKVPDIIHARGVVRRRMEELKNERD